ncbi:hypothetical protein D3C81_501040 [compost metagenome]
MVKVLKDFRDRHTRKIYRKGQTYDGKNQEYLSHLQSLGYVEIEEKKPNRRNKKDDGQAVK